MKATIKATPEMMTLAQESLDIQNACNACGLAQRFAKVMSTLMSSDQRTGTNWVNQNPVVILWIDKLADLARSGHNADIGLAYDAVHALSQGKDVEWPIV